MTVALGSDRPGKAKTCVSEEGTWGGGRGVREQEQPGSGLLCLQARRPCHWHCRAGDRPMQSRETVREFGGTRERIPQEQLTTSPGVDPRGPSGWLMRARPSRSSFARTSGGINPSARQTNSRTPKERSEGRCPLFSAYLGSEGDRIVPKKLHRRGQPALVVCEPSPNPHVWSTRNFPHSTSQSREDVRKLVRRKP